MMDTRTALDALGRMGKTRLVERMVRIVKGAGYVPTWIENEIRFDSVPNPPSGMGNTSGNAVVCADRNYHGGYTE